MQEEAPAVDAEGRGAPHPEPTSGERDDDDTIGIYDDDGEVKLCETSSPDSTLPAGEEGEEGVPAAADPSIEPTSFPRLGSAAVSQQQQPSSNSQGDARCEGKQKMPRIRQTKSAAVQRYAQPLPQTAFANFLKDRERQIHKRIAEMNDHEQSHRPKTASTTAAALASDLCTEETSKRVGKVLKSFPTTSVRDPFCPKPPVHPSPIRLEASVLAAQRMFPSNDKGKATTVHRQQAHRAAKESTSSVRDLLPMTTAGVSELPILVTGPSPSFDNSDSDSFACPNHETKPQRQSSAPVGSGARIEERLALRGSGRVSTARPQDRGDTTEGTSTSTGMDALLTFLPKSYTEPEVLMKQKPLAHPNDPVTGKPRPARHYRLGLQSDPANDVTPAEAAQALQHRGLPTTLSVASTDPAVLAIVDSFIESSPGLEHVVLGAMDDRYEMVLRNVFAALSRNVSVADVKGIFPKEATKAFKSTIEANSERRRKRLDQLASKEMELKITDMEQRILKERQLYKKRYFEHMRQRTRLCEQHMRSHRELLREEADAWERLYGHEDTSLQEVREKERLRFEWWTASVESLEQLMTSARQNDSREEHLAREKLRLGEVNQRMATQAELRRHQKQIDNDRHIILAEQFDLRKRIRGEEKQQRRTIEQGLLNHLKLFLEERAREERRRREEEILRRQDESFKAERLRRLEQAQEILADNQLERRKLYEVEAWKAYDVFKRKHFEGIVVAKNQQRVREIREKRQAAFAAADGAVPLLQFRMTPQTVSTLAITSAVQNPNNTLAYNLNPVGDFLVMNSNAILGVQFDMDMSPLMIKQKLSKVEPQGGVISCKIHRASHRDVEEGREGIALFISSCPAEDPNVQITNHIEKEPGRVILPPSSGLRDRSPEPKLSTTLSAAPSGSYDASRRVSSVAPQSSPGGSRSGRRGRAGSTTQLKPPGLNNSSTSPQRPGDEVEAERTFNELCGEDRVCGVLHVREDTDEWSRGSAKDTSPGQHNSDFLQDAKGDVVPGNLLDLNLETESDSEDSLNSSSNSGRGKLSKQRKGYGSMKIRETTAPARRPKRRIVSWNGTDVGVVELGFAGAPIECTSMIPFYANASIHRVRSRQSAITMQLDKRRGTLDVKETTSPGDQPLPLRRAPTEPSSTSVAQSSCVEDAAGVEVFRLRLLPNVPRHAISDILAHLSYFNSAGVTSMRHSAMEQLASNEVVQVSTHLSVAFRRSCLPPTHPSAQDQPSGKRRGSEFSPQTHKRGIDQMSPAGQFLLPSRTPNSPQIAIDPGFSHRERHLEHNLRSPDPDELRKVSDLSDVSSSRRRGAGRRRSCDPNVFYGVDCSQLVWSTRTTNSYIKLHLPLFFGVPQREPVYFLEDQAPQPLVPATKFGWCFPVSSTFASSAAVDTLMMAAPLQSSQSPMLGRSLNNGGRGFSTASFGDENDSFSSSYSSAALNYITNSGKHIVIRDMSDGTLDAIDMVVGRHAVSGMHVFLSIIGQSRGDVFVLLDTAGLSLGPEREVTHIPQESDVGALAPYGRRMVERLGDCTRKQVGVESSRLMRELYYRGELVAYVSGLILTPREFHEYGPWFAEDAATVAGESSTTSEMISGAVNSLQDLAAAVAAAATSANGTLQGGSSSVFPANINHHNSSSQMGTPPTGLSASSSAQNLKTLSRTLSSAACKRGPVVIELLSNRFVSMGALRDIICSVAYANLNKDPSPIKRYVDVCLADKQRKNTSLVRSEVTVVPVDDITEIDLKTPSWGFRVCRSPTETKPELVQYLPTERPFFVAPDALAVDPDTVYFEGGWLEVEIIDGAKDGDILYLLQDDRIYVENAHQWSADTVRQCSRLYSERRQSTTQVGSDPLNANSPEFSFFARNDGGSARPSVDCSSPTFDTAGPMNPSASARASPALPPLGVVAMSGTFGNSVTNSGSVQHPIITMSAFSEDEDEPHSELVVTSGLALEDIPPMVSKREMSRGRASGGSFSINPNATVQGNAGAQGSATPGGATPDTLGLKPPHLTIPIGRVSLTPDFGTNPGVENLERASGNGLHYTSPLIRIEFKSLSLAGLQYILRHIAFKSVVASEKNTKYFGTRTIEFRTIVGDPNVPKFRKFDPFVPIVNHTKIKLCEPLLKNSMPHMSYKEGQGTMGIAVGLCDPGTEGYRCFNRGHFSAAIVKGATADDRLLLRSVDPSQFDFGLSFLDVDPLTIFQPKRTASLHNLKRASSMRGPSGQQQSHLSPAQQTYVPGVGGVGPDGEINPNCPPPPPSLSLQWVKAITTGKYKFQQWKCSELYNNERAMVGFLTSTTSEVYVGFREADKVRKFGRAVALAPAAPATPSAPVAAPSLSGSGSTPSKGAPQTSPPPALAPLGSAVPHPPSTSPAPPTASGKKKKGQGKEKSLSMNYYAEKESRAIPIPLPDGATPVRYTDVLSITKLISFENRSSNPTDLKKIVLISLSDEHTTSHLVVEITVQPVDDATEIRKNFPGPLTFRNGFPGSYVPVFDHCSLFDPDTELFNGGHLHISLSQAPSEGDLLRFLSLDEQRKHRELFGKDPYSKYRARIGASTKGGDSGSSLKASDAPGRKPAAGKSPTRDKGRPGKSPVRETEGGALPKTAPEAPKEKDPNEPYEFVVDHKRKVIYWVDRVKATSTAEAPPPLHTFEITAPTPSHGGRFIQSGAFVRETPKNSTSAPITFGMFARQELKLPDESVLRRVASYATNVDSKSKLTKGSAQSTTGAASAAAGAGEGDVSTPPSVAAAMPNISVTDSTVFARGGLEGSPFDASAFVDPSLIMSLGPGSWYPGGSSTQLGVPSALNIQMQIEPLVDEDDLEEGDTTERVAPVNINMLQALMRSVVYLNVNAPAKTKSGTRVFGARVGAAAGGEDGRAKVAVQIAGSLIGWVDNIPPTNVTFRPRMGNVMPLARLVFLSDLIVKTGFLLIEIAEGFEPTEDVIKLNDIGRMMIVKNGKIFLQPKDQLIGNLVPQELDGVPYGFLVTIDSNCRVSGSVLQSLCRSFSYTNTSRRTGQRKVRVTICDGTIYETSTVEVPLSLEQDEHTVPARFGTSNGCVVWMEGCDPVRVFPDLILTLKSANIDRILEPPNVLEIETQVGGCLSLSSVDNIVVDLEREKILIDGEEVAKIVQADASEDAATPRHPAAGGGGSRKSFSRTSIARRGTRDGSVVSLAAMTLLTGSSSGASSGAAVSPNGRRLSPRHSVASGNQQFDRAPHILRVEFLSCKMEFLEQIIRCVRFSCGTMSPGGPSPDAPYRDSAGSIDETNVGSFALLSGTPPHPPRQPQPSGARRSIVKFGSHDDSGGFGAVATQSSVGASLAFTPNALPSQFTVTLQLNGITNDVGKVSPTPSLHIQSMVRICESASLFSVPPSPVPQGVGGDVFSGIIVRFTPRWVRVSWRAALDVPTGEEDVEESQQLDARNAAAAQAVASLQLFVSNRLGLVVSASGDEVSYGRDKVANVISKASYSRARSIVRSKSVVAALPPGSPRLGSGELAASTDDSGPLVQLHNSTSVLDDGCADDMDEYSMVASSHHQRAFCNPQQIIFEISTTRRVPPETISRLLRSIVTHPSLAHSVQFTLCFEASEEVSTTRALVVVPHGSGGGRRLSMSHRGSLGGVARGIAGLARLGSQRKTSSAGGGGAVVAPLAPSAPVVVERLGRQNQRSKKENQ